MITRVEVRNFKCLRALDQGLRPFQILIGPNASGKSTFLDVLAFVRDLVSNDLDAAFAARGRNPHDLISDPPCDPGVAPGLHIALEARLPRSVAVQHGDGVSGIRYDVWIDVPGNDAPGIRSEQVALVVPDESDFTEPVIDDIPGSRYGDDRLSALFTADKEGRTRRIISRQLKGETSYFAEVGDPYGVVGAFKFIPRLSALGNLPQDETQFPAATWFRNLLVGNIRPIELSPSVLRTPSLRHSSAQDASGGAWIAWMLADLASNAGPRARYTYWIDHLRTALPEVQRVESVHLPGTDTRHLVFHYSDGVSVPAWLASEGTLRLTALTLLAYQPDFHGVYLIEEPENGLHPRNIETAYQALSSAYEAQVLLTSHSPVLLGMAAPEELLCFRRTAGSGTAVVQGDEHPSLSDWHGEISLGTLFGAGVLD